MLVKIFEEMDKEKLEAAINEFFRINPVRICHVTQSQSEIQDGMGPVKIISIFFEDYE